MAKKKAAVEVPPCLHCSKVFQFPVKWCPHCEDHFSMEAWVKGKDTCDRCHAGDNDEYLKRKKRLAKREYQPPHPLTAEDKLFIQHYLDWVASPEYADRFKLRFIQATSTHMDFCVHCNHAKAYHEKTCVAWGDKPCKCKGFEPQPAPKPEKKQ